MSESVDPRSNPDPRARVSRELIWHVAQSSDLDDKFRRDLDAALCRLRFALDRLESGETP